VHQIMLAYLVDLMVLCRDGFLAYNRLLILRYIDAQQSKQVLEPGIPRWVDFHSLIGLGAIRAMVTSQFGVMLNDCHSRSTGSLGRSDRFRATPSGRRIHSVGRAHRQEAVAHCRCMSNRLLQTILIWREAILPFAVVGLDMMICGRWWQSSGVFRGAGIATSDLSSGDSMALVFWDRTLLIRGFSVGTVRLDRASLEARNLGIGGGLRKTISHHHLQENEPHRRARLPDYAALGLHEWLYLGFLVILIARCPQRTTALTP
jgi:hypothetical protein